MRHAAVAELADQVIQAGELLQLGDLLDAVVGCTDHLDLDVEFRRLLAEALVLHLGIRLRHAAVELVTLHHGQVAVGEVVVGVDRVPLARQVLRGALVGLLAGLGHRDVGGDDRRTRRVPDAGRDIAIASDVLGRLRPLVLHDDQEAEAELGHDLRRLRADRRRIEPPLRIGHRPRPDRHFWNFVELPVPFEDFVTQCFGHELRGFGEARPRLLHRHAEARILHGGRTTAEAEHTAAVGEDVEERDLLGHPHRVVPRQHDHGGAERDPLRPAGDVAEQLGW